VTLALFALSRRAVMVGSVMLTTAGFASIAFNTETIALNVTANMRTGLAGCQTQDRKTGQ